MAATRSTDVQYNMPAGSTALDVRGGHLPFKNIGTATILSNTNITAIGSGTLGDTMISGVLMPYSATTAILHLYAWADAAGAIATTTLTGAVNSTAQSIWFPVDAPTAVTAPTARGTVAGIILFTKSNAS